MAENGMDNLIAMILEGDCAESVSQAKALLESGVEPKTDRHGWHRGRHVQVERKMHA